MALHRCDPVASVWTPSSAARPPASGSWFRSPRVRLGGPVGAHRTGRVPHHHVCTGGSPCGLAHLIPAAGSAITTVWHGGSGRRQGTYVRFQAPLTALTALTATSGSCGAADLLAAVRVGCLVENVHLAGWNTRRDRTTRHHGPTRWESCCQHCQHRQPGARGHLAVDRRWPPDLPLRPAGEAAPRSPDRSSTSATGLWRR